MLSQKIMGLDQPDQWYYKGQCWKKKRSSSFTPLQEKPARKKADVLTGNSQGSLESFSLREQRMGIYVGVCCSNPHGESGNASEQAATVSFFKAKKP